MNVSTHDYLDPATLAAIAPLSVRARRVADGIVTGMHRSPHRGVSVEFAEHRPYVPGDDLRHLDWKVFGRSDKLYVKQYQQETNLEIRLVVDVSGSMRYSSQSTGWTKYDHAASLVAALAWLALEQRDRVGLVLFDRQVRDEVRPSAAGGHWRSLVTSLERGRPADDSIEETDLPAALRRASPGGARRGLVVVASDLLEDPQRLEPALARLRHRGQDVVLLQVMDPAERRFPFRSPAEFRGLEGEAPVRMDPAALREGYLEALARHQRRIGDTARRFGFDWLRLDSSESLGPPLARLLARRQVMVERGRP